MDRNCAIVRVVDGVLAHVGVLDGANHVEMDRVPSHATHLAGIAHLDVLDSCYERLALGAICDALVRARVQHDVHAVLVELRHIIARDDDVARKDGHVGTKRNGVAAVEVLDLAEVTIHERLNELDACAAIEQRLNPIRLRLL